MPRRPQPLTDISSSISYPNDGAHLTPRTPHSRLGRAEEGFTEVELQEVNHGDEPHVNYRHEQSEPLLSSSASNSFPDQRRHHEYDIDAVDAHFAKSFNSWKSRLDAPTILSRLPVVAATMVGGLLLFMLVVAYRQPGALERYYGFSTNTSTLSTTGDTADSLEIHPIISYENYTQFPLQPDEYRTECWKVHKTFMGHTGFWSAPTMGIADVVHPSQDGGVCKSSITYMLDGNVGLLADLALIAQAAAFARERNRTFFIDDTYWDRGKWTDYFEDVSATQPGPEPGCLRPPPRELVACPRLARHWVVNSRTAKFHFGDAFANEYENPYQRQLGRLKPMFEHAFESLRTTILPTKSILALIQQTREELLSLTSTNGVPKYISVHVRRGDNKPTTAKYHGNYVPISEYVESATSVWSKLVTESSNGNSPPIPLIYLASDHPSVFVEFNVELKAKSNRGTMFSLATSSSQDLRSLASPKEYFQAEFDDLSIESRTQATKGMIIDFALLSGAWTVSNHEPLMPDSILCTIRSAVCKLAPIPMGWDSAFGLINESGDIDNDHKRWIELDEKGIYLPVWKAFDLF